MVKNLNIFNRVKSPLISVIMPVYNADKYLYESIESILNQTYSNFELLVLDDASTDASVQVASMFKDERVKIFTSQKNMGIVHQLNKGIKFASGKYLARMDQDDIALPERFEKQVQFMETNIHIGVCGTWLEAFGAKKNEVWKVPCAHEHIAVMIFFGNCMFHPTVMIRSSQIVEGYSEGYLHAEDYELWSRLISRGVKFSNIPEVLLRYRIHENQTSSSSKSLQQQSAVRIRLRELSRLKLNCRTSMAFITALNTCQLSDLSLNDFSIWINNLIINNERYQVYPAEQFREELKVRWEQIMSSNSHSLIRSLALYNSIFTSGMPLQTLAKVTLKVLLRN